MHDDDGVRWVVAVPVTERSSGLNHPFDDALLSSFHRWNWRAISTNQISPPASEPRLRRTQPASSAGPCSSFECGSALQLLGKLFWIDLRFNYMVTSRPGAGGWGSHANHTFSFGRWLLQWTAPKPNKNFRVCQDPRVGFKPSEILSLLSCPVDCHNSQLPLASLSPSHSPARSPSVCPCKINTLHSHSQS